MAEIVQKFGVSFEPNSSSQSQVLQNIAAKKGIEILSEEFAKLMDDNDKLRNMKDEFVFPKRDDTRKANCSDKELIYLAGNVLGLQPKQARVLMAEVLQNWQDHAVECHVTKPIPAASCLNYVTEQKTRLVGAKEIEVSSMHTKEINLHLMLVSFYRPTKQRHKILMDSRDENLCIAESHIKQHGFLVADSLITVKYKPGKYVLNMDDIIDIIKSEGDSISTILLPGVLPMSGQLLDMKAITKVGHEKECMVGFDLSHSVGNVDLHLNEWQVDFACWDTEKYLNSGPDSLGYAFLHEKHANNDFQKFLGWWGHKPESRFDMTNQLDLSPGIKGYRISNHPPTLVANIKSSLNIFDKTSMLELQEKSFLLTGYLDYLLKQYFPKPSSTGMSGIGIDVITPCCFSQRGSQLSLRFTRNLKEVQRELRKRRIICSILPPDVMSVCPAPLYCSFEDVYQFVSELRDIIKKFS